MLSLFVFLFVGKALAQETLSDYPVCADACTTRFVSESNCASTNYACLCSDPNYLTLGHNCINASCSAGDAALAHSLDAEFCESYGVNVSTVVTFTSVATATATAAVNSGSPSAANTGTASSSDSSSSSSPSPSSSSDNSSGVSTDTIIAIVFGILGAVLTDIGLYISWRTLQYTKTPRSEEQPRPPYLQYMLHPRQHNYKPEPVRAVSNTFKY